MEATRTVGFYGGKFSPPHMGHIATAVQAAASVDWLYVVVCESEEWERANLYQDAKIPYPTGRLRERWLRETLKDIPNITVCTIDHPATNNPAEDWEIGAERIKEAIGESITHVFYNEPEYTPDMQRLHPGAELVMLDPQRTSVPISATMIRTEGALKHWDNLPAAVRAHYVKRVVILGTESCGKSTLTKQLATLYNTNYVEEYGRTLLEGKNDPYTIPEDYPVIAMQHFLNVEAACKTANRVLFVDTEANVTQNFSKMYEGFHQDVVGEIAKLQKFDLGLFLTPEVAWVDDGTRVFGDPGVRTAAAENLLQLVHQNNPGMNLRIIKGGSYQARFQQAVQAVNKLITD